MQLLQPLAILDIAFTSRHMLGLPRIDQQDFKASLFELLSLARTRMGEDTLATWLLSPSPLAEIKQRHAAIGQRP